MKLYILFILVFFCATVFSQTNTDTIAYYNNKKGVVFAQNDRVLKFRDVKRIVKTDYDAYLKFKKARNLEIKCNIIGFFAGFVPGFFIGLPSASRETKILSCAVGAGALIYVFSMKEEIDNRILQSVIVYNKNVLTKTE